MLVKQAIRAVAILLKKVIEDKAFFACLGGYFVICLGLLLFLFYLVFVNDECF